MDNKNLSLPSGYTWIFIVYTKNINCHGTKEVFVTNNKSVAKFTKFDFIQSLNINKLNTNYKNEIGEKNHIHIWIIHTIW